MPEPRWREGQAAVSRVRPMPEGHTLHRLALDHRRDLEGRRVQVSSPQGRFEEAAELDGQQIAAVEALGKHLFYAFASGVSLHVHLGLFGRFRRFTAQPPPPPRGAVRMRLSSGAVTLDLSGPTACEVLTPEQVHALQARLGPDLLRPDAKSSTAWARIAKSRRSIGALLLDQSILSGVGNVYRAEGLFLAEVHPEREGRALTRQEFTRLWKVLRALLTKGVKDRRIVTVPHPPTGPGKRPPRGERTWVYGQRACKKCGSAVRRFALGNRTMYACDACQR